MIPFEISDNSDSSNKTTDSGDIIQQVRKEYLSSNKLKVLGNGAHWGKRSPNEAMF